MDQPGQATRLLRRVEGGDLAASEELLALLYGELRGLAAQAMGRERVSHTLQPTALVHEAWMRLLGAGAPTHFEGREHFVALAAKAMRRVLVDHARGRGAEKRGRDWTPVPLDSVLAGFEERRLDLIAVDAALEKLGELDPELARLVELRFFAGLTIAETASLLGVSTPTVERHWRVARMWLRREMPELA
ncbi:MAG: sigma-70 family RNA polymerase sigma factor [Planctomycetota bacterium]|nr:sigma-70 family RNA polymerase sigma factor [Planctomycetota bacterium]